MRPPPPRSNLRASSLSTGLAPRVLSWGDFEYPTASFLLVPLIHDVLQTHGGNAIYAARNLVARYGYDWDTWVAAYREDFAAREITSAFPGIGMGYIQPRVQEFLTLNAPDGASSIDAGVPGQIARCYDLMRADYQRGALSIPGQIAQSDSRGSSNSSLASSRTSSSHTPSFSLSSLPSSSSSSRAEQRRPARELSWGGIDVDRSRSELHASYLYVPLIRAALRMDSQPSRVQRELDSIAASRGNFEELVKRYRADFAARGITGQTLLDNREVDLSDGYIQQPVQERLLYTAHNHDAPGESRVQEETETLLQRCFYALHEARRAGRL